MTKTKMHSFDWHQENRDNTFLAWAVLTMMPTGARTGNDADFFNELSEATNKFTECELGITLSGVPIDAEKFMKRLDEAVDSAVELEAKKMLLERVPRIQEIGDAVAGFESAIKEHMHRLAAEAGFEVTEDDWRYR